MAGLHLGDQGTGCSRCVGKDLAMSGSPVCRIVDYQQHIRAFYLLLSGSVPGVHPGDQGTGSSRRVEKDLVMSGSSVC